MYDNKKVMFEKKILKRNKFRVGLKQLDCSLDSERGNSAIKDTTFRQYQKIK